MTITIENMRTGHISRTEHPQEDSERLLRELGLLNEMFSTTEINFPAATSNDLQQILRELGLDVNTLASHAE